jgi:hypothetical protein
MKNEMYKMIQEVMNPMLSEVERKTLAIQVAYELLNAADFELVVDEDGALSVFSNEGEIILRKDGVVFVEVD